MIQYEKEDALFGSQYSSLNYIGAYYKSDTLRKLSLVPLVEISSIEQIEEIIKSNASAVLFIIPKNLQNNSKLSQLISEIQVYLCIFEYLTYLAEQTLYIPVYFTFDNESIQNNLQELKRQDEISNTNSKVNQKIF